MSMQRYFAVLTALVVAILAFLVLVIPRHDFSDANFSEANFSETNLSEAVAPHSGATPSQADRRDFNLQLDSMRAMHKKMLSATSAEARNSLLDDSARIMSDGVSMMRRMKPGLPTTATGEPISNLITQVEFDRVKDFMLLMDLLLEMKGDRDAALVLDRPPLRASTPVQIIAVGPQSPVSQEKAATLQLATK